MTYEAKYEVMSYMVPQSISISDFKASANSKPTYTVETKKVVLPVFLELRKEYQTYTDDYKYLVKVEINGGIELIGIHYSHDMASSDKALSDFLIPFLASAIRKHMGKHPLYQDVPQTVLACIHSRALSFLRHVHDNDLFNDPVKITSFKPTGPVAEFGIIQGSLNYIPASGYTGFMGGVSSHGVERKSRKLPGVMNEVVKPCTCYDNYMVAKEHGMAIGPAAERTGLLWNVIQHLNDSHSEWTREKIADWMDELHDAGEIDIEFKPDFDAKEKPVLDDSDADNVQFNDTVEKNPLPAGWKPLGYTIEKNVDIKADLDKASKAFKEFAEKVEALKLSDEDWNFSIPDDLEGGKNEDK